MKCIICLQERPPSDEHVIPDSVGGNLRIKDVCRDCNSKLSQFVDGPFSQSPVVELARYALQIGGKRDKIPNPLAGVGTTNDGHKVSLSRDLKPYAIRSINASEEVDDKIQIQLTADASDIERLDEVLGKPLKKLLIEKRPEWSESKIDQEVSKVVDAAKNSKIQSSQPTVQQQWKIKFDALVPEFVKIAYECWFRQFGHSWVEGSQTAKLLREALLDTSKVSLVRVGFLCDSLPIPHSDPMKNHCIVLSGGICHIRLFTLNCTVECEEALDAFKLDTTDAVVILQDFIDGALIEKQLVDFLAGNFEHSLQSKPALEDQFTKPAT